MSSVDKPVTSPTVDSTGDPQGGIFPDMPFKQELDGAALGYRHLTSSRLVQPTPFTVAQFQLQLQVIPLSALGTLIPVAGSGGNNFFVVGQNPVAPSPPIMPNIQGEAEDQPEGVSSSSSEPPPAQVEVLENPVFVNSKQYLRILQRRVERARLQDRIRDKERVKYLHESRHLHAANRVRGQGGRFQTGSTKGKKRSGTRRKICSLLL